MSAFDRYAPFIQDFIYSHGWDELRGVQVAAADVIFNSDDNLLLCASTASGKTEAAFFPILTLMSEDPPASVGALYIGPLKALINDQFSRLNDLCEEAGIPVWHWHGDVPQSHKARLLKHPSGILQITPESLEALLVHKHAAIGRLFGDLRFVVIDEVHSLLRGDRGGQTLCCIERLSRLAGVNPRRVGLSATIGDPELTGRILSAGSGRATAIPQVREKPRVWRLSMEHFYVRGPQASDLRWRGEAGPGPSPSGSAAPIEVEALSCVAVGEGEGGSRGAAGLRGLPEPSGAAPGPQAGGRPPGPGAARAAGEAAVAGFLASEAPLAPRSGPVGRQAPLAPGAPLAAWQGDGAGGAARVPGSAPGAPLVEYAGAAASDRAPLAADPGLGYIFEHTRDKKCLVFVNSREECETATTTLRQYCEARGEPDRFLIHHGNLSASFRQTAEAAMKDDGCALTTVTTATLELGIDVGRLERAFQIDAPFTVSSFLQRMGRTGRRGDPPEMWFVMREDEPEPRAMLPESVPWKLVQGVALVQLYLEEGWVEPPRPDRLPYSLLYHQTMSTLASSGELSAGQLAKRVLTLSWFSQVSADDFRLLLRHLIEIDHIERTERDGLIVGLAGERVVNSFKFYAVFQESEEYTVRSESQDIGTVVMPPPAGERIALAGHVWVVDEVDHKRHLVYCTQVKGRVPAYFGDCPGDINTRVLERMRLALRDGAPYPYLGPNARARLSLARRAAANAGIADKPLVNLGGTMWCLFPWLGSYAFLALERLLKLRCAARLGLKGLDSSRPYFMQFRMAPGVDEGTFYHVVKEEAEVDFDPMELVYPGEVPLFDKYDAFLPQELVRKGFAEGVLDIEGMRERVRGW